MEGRIIGTDKHPVVRPVGFGDTWIFLMERFVLSVAALEAKEDCGTEHLFRRIEAGIEEVIHYIRMLWQHHAQEDDWWFFLVDTHCLGGMRLLFNCFHHYATLVICSMRVHVNPFTSWR